MIASRNYASVDGEILSETRSAAQRDYLPDPFGSTAALYDTSGNKTDEYVYWPDGETRTHTGSNPTPFTWVGTLGYYSDDSGAYARARTVCKELGRWVQVDPLWADEPAFSYASLAPSHTIDPSGLLALTSSCNDIWASLPTDARDAIWKCFKKCPNDRRTFSKCVMDSIKDGSKEKFWEYLACIYGNALFHPPRGPWDPNPCECPVDCVACCGGNYDACIIRCSVERSKWDIFGIGYNTCLLACKSKSEYCLANCSEDQAGNPWPGVVKGEPIKKGG